MSIPFLQRQNEDETTRFLALIAITGVTAALAFFNVAGAIGSTSGGGALWVLRGAFAICIAFAEFLTALTLVRVMLAPNRLRKVVGGAIFLGLAWVCVQNGKAGAHLIFPDKLAESPAALNARAKIADGVAARMAKRTDRVDSSAGTELTLVRTQIAALEAEQTLMAAQSPEKIREAQKLLTAKGKYFGAIDGISERLTESAMRARGEEISQELKLLRLRESGMIDGAALPTDEAAANKAIEAVKLREKAAVAETAGFWIEVMLWVLEGARSFGLWAFVSVATAGSVGAVRKAEQEIELEQLRAELDRVRSAPPAGPTPAEPEDPVAAHDKNAAAAKGGLSSQEKRRNDADPIKIPVGDWPARDGRTTMEEAAG